MTPVDVTIFMAVIQHVITSFSDSLVLVHNARRLYSRPARTPTLCIYAE